MFDSDFFLSNRNSLRDRFDDGSLFIFTANGLVQRSGSTTFPFKQDSNFWYLTGIDSPDVLLVMDGDAEFLILPDRTEVFEKFNGTIDKSALSAVSGIREIYSYQEGMDKFSTAIKKSKKTVTCLPPDDYVEACGFYPNPARRRLLHAVSAIDSNAEVLDARTEFAKLRMLKKPIEIAAIENAISVTAAAFNDIKQNIANYKTENEIITELTMQFIKNGATGHAYDAIVASGRNACVLHYLPKKSKFKKDDLVLIDAGAEVGNYASDLTRTYALSAPSVRQQEVFDAVMDIREYALSLLKPGIPFKDYEASVREHAGKVIKKLELKNLDTSVYYPHATSHFLGLDVHDAGDYSAPLAENMVLTVEPGIYIKEEGIGIRIEDNILITSSGYKNLSQQLPRELI